MSRAVFRRRQVPHQTVAVHVIEAQELLGPVRAAVGGPPATGMAHARQRDPRERAQFQRPALVETDYRSASRPPLVEAKDARFFASNAGSGEAFQVLSRWGVTPSRRRTRRTHSSVIAGKRPRCLQYAVSLAVDHSVKGKPRSAGRLRATLTSSRTWGPSRMGSRPQGLVGRSNVSKPEVLKRWSPQVRSLRVTAHAVGDFGDGPAPQRLGHDPIPLVEPHGQRPSAEFGVKQSSFAGSHAPNGERMHGGPPLPRCRVACLLPPSYHHRSIYLDRH